MKFPDERLGEALDMINALTVAGKKNDEKIAKFKADAVSIMEESEIESLFYQGHQPVIADTGDVSLSDETVRFKATLVKSETTKVDENKLMLSVGPEIWDKITIRKLDMGLVDAAVAEGLMSLEQLSECVSYKPRARWIRITESPEREEEE